MNNACPSCGAVYSVQPQHIGRRIACKKCGASLSVDSDGLRLADGEAPAASAAVELPAVPALEDNLEITPSRLAGSRPAKSTPFLPLLRSRWDQVRSIVDLPLCLLVAGLLSIVSGTALPLIDRAAVARHAAQLQAQEARTLRYERDWKERPNEDESERQCTRTAARREHAQLADALDEATLAAARAQPHYHWAILIGTLCLAAAALGFLRDSQPLVRRIMGAIVLLTISLGGFVMWMWK